MRHEWSVSIRRACRVFQLDTSTYHYTGSDMIHRIDTGLVGTCFLSKTGYRFLRYNTDIR